MSPCHLHKNYDRGRNKTYERLFSTTNYYLLEIITSLINSKPHNKTKHNYCLSDVIQIRKVNNIETTYIIGKNVIKSFFKFEK